MLGKERTHQIASSGNLSSNPGWGYSFFTMSITTTTTPIGGTFNETVIIVGDGIGDQCSNPGQSWLCFTLNKCTWERHDSYSSPTDMNK